MWTMELCDGVTDHDPVNPNKPDPHAPMIIRWRYVVVIEGCDDNKATCREQHCLLKCGKNNIYGGGDHNCAPIESVVTGYETGTLPGGWGFWWVTRCPTGNCPCEPYDQSNYPGCDFTNFHYNWWCAPTGACCGGPKSGCQIMSEAECNALGGIYYGDGTTCEDIDCNVIPTLTEWGLIVFGVALAGWMAWIVMRRRKKATAGF